jgi:signal transduction histidine kinase
MTDATPVTVLLNVDDHEPARYARTRILRKAGFEVHEASTGADALKLAEMVNPAIILLDVHLPDMNGIEVCRRMKLQDRGAGTLVLQISASAISAPQATAALNTGADAYLVEPVDPDVLVATVRAFLRLRSAERALSIANLELSEKNAALNKANEALKQSNEDLAHFAYVASHDLQEPLRNISTHLQLLERLTGGRFDASEKQLFSVVVDSARRMGTLIQDVLAYSGIGRKKMELKPASLNEALEWALANLSGSIVTSGATVAYADLPTAMGDSMQLSQVFQNLIGNSIKYRSGTVPLRVEITSERAPDALVIHVRDNGIGIAENSIPEIFLPFKRLHNAEIPGSGIGLALCRRIVEGHGGRIWAESAEGVGSTFSFTLRPAG